ncbi:hypothetical protein [Nocardioides sp. WS12]|uniref:hypothetical protein n=1 Tax=Nocardioides sp. WS12 TaxID=2486272 RepID=UPI0015FB0AF3|nr:hypothetical protein [Nocardioides sp. WS12]
MNTTATGGTARPPYRRARIALVIAGLALAGSGLSGAQAPAGAVGPTGDGSDWGPQGTLSSDSAVTVRWDNASNPESSVVPRNGQQLIPHTDFKTYDDISSTLVDAYNQHFHDLSVTVSQTRNLVNQSINLDFEGAIGGPVTPGASQSTAYFQVFQCWGGVTGTGKPDPAAANPDPATCQVGAGGPDFVDSEEGQKRKVSEDQLVLGGDWDSIYRANGYAPYVGINGDKVDGQEGKNTFYNRSDTNELSNVTVSDAGSAQRQFEVQTTVESYGLGCGKRAGVPSTRPCWLVVVPRLLPQLRNAGPISPSLWAQRLQVRLDFRDVAAGCPGGKAGTPIGGSEMLTTAAESWVPGVCDARDIAVRYSQISDPVARSQFVTGQNQAIAASESPAAAAVPVPLALAAPVISYQLTYQPACIDNPATTDEGARTSCGYDNLDQMVADHRRAGSPVRDLKLDARLVAKLLTQSYSKAILDDAAQLPIAAWGRPPRPQFLTQDPEFKRLNPHLSHLGPAVGQSLDHLIVEGMRSDAATRVWQWIMADPDGRAFMNGCPDAEGIKVNPFYSTRTYVGCEERKSELSKQADADREETTKAATYTDQVPTYPPPGSPYPLPTWQEFPGTSDKRAYTLIDLLPRAESMPSSGREVGRGHIPINKYGDWCPSNTDDECQPAPGKYKADKKRQNPTQLNLMAITDSATAARWRVPTATLCNSAGDQCVGADVASMRKAADRFEKDAVNWYTPGDTDLAAGAYPLTLPVYAALDPELPLSDRKVYADALEFITTKGQVPGFEAGELPPGYAPLPNTLRDQARAGIAELRKAVPVVVAPPGPGNTGAGAGGTPEAVTPPAVAPVADPNAAAPVPNPAIATDEIMAVSASTETWDWWTIPLGLAVAMFAGLGGPIMRLRGRFVVGR